MSKNTEIEERINAAMNSLDGIQSATPAAFFFTRLQAKLNKTEISVWEKLTSIIARPSIAFAVIFFIVLMNSLAVFQHNYSASSISEQQSEQSFYDEYNIASNTFYDNENPEP